MRRCRGRGRRACLSFASLKDLANTTDEFMRARSGMGSVFEAHRGGDGTARTGSRSRLGVLLLLIAALIGVPVALAGTAGASTPAPRLAATACTGGTYTVVANDGWWLIATKLKISMTTLLAANGATVATMIHPGDVLCVPAGGTATSVTTTTGSPSTTPPATTPSTGTGTV